MVLSCLARAFAFIYASIVLANTVAAGSLCQAVSAPAYYWPLAQGHPYNPDYAAFKLSRVETVVFPGPLAKEPGESDALYTARIFAFQTMVKDLRANGIRVLGYISTNYGDRPLSDVNADIARYRQIFKGLQVIDGYFLDETSTDPAKLAFYKLVARTIQRGDGGYIMLNPGTYPPTAELFKIGDVIVAFEGTAAAHSALIAPTYAATLPSSKIAHIVHTAPDTVQAVRAIVAKARSMNAQYVFVTHMSAAPGVNTFGVLPKQLPKLEIEIGLACD